MALADDAAAAAPTAAAAAAAAPADVDDDDDDAGDAGGAAPRPEDAPPPAAAPAGAGSIAGGGGGGGGTSNGGSGGGAASIGGAGASGGPTSTGGAAAGGAAGGGGGSGGGEANAVCAEPKLFVGALRYDATADDVRAHFAARYGAVRSAVLLRHHETGRSKGCALVLLGSWTAAEAAVTREHGAPSPLTAPRPAVVRYADPQRGETGALCGVTPKKLFIGQVPPEVTEEQVRAIFEPFGAIVDLNIMPPRKPGSMGERGAGGARGWRGGKRERERERERSRRP